jgi:hypothetical protein
MLVGADDVRDRGEFREINFAHNANSGCKVDLQARIILRPLPVLEPFVEQVPHPVPESLTTLFELRDRAVIRARYKGTAFGTVSERR